jgi:hypothetical protein
MHLHGAENLRHFRFSKIFTPLFYLFRLHFARDPVLDHLHMFLQFVISLRSGLRCGLVTRRRVGEALSSSYYYSSLSLSSLFNPLNTSFLPSGVKSSGVRRSKITK